MERIETLLKHDMGSNFDTRKTLNRSNVTVPDAILEQIESGSFTCEMIDELSKKFPIFRYQTQITIHGEFSVTNSRISGYKNIFQNANRSLGVKYSAIDTEKIKEIRSMLGSVYLIGAGEDVNYFYYLENSQHRVFRRSHPIYKENFDKLKSLYLSLANEIKKVNIYGYVDCYIAPQLYGGNRIYLDIHPLAIPTNKISELVYAMLGMNEVTYNQKVTEIEKIRKEKERINNIQTLERDNKRVAFMERRKTFFNLYKTTNLGELVKLSSENPLVCKLNVKENEDMVPEFEFIEYVFYRINGKGSFGKMKIERGTNVICDFSTAKWEDYKQMKLSDISIKGYIVNNPKVEVATTFIKTEISGTQDMQLIDYSEKSIAIIGNTKPYKDLLGANGLGGKFNFALTVNGERVAGWIFSKKRLEEVKNKLGL